MKGLNVHVAVLGAPFSQLKKKVKFYFAMDKNVDTVYNTEVLFVDIHGSSPVMLEMFASDDTAGAGDLNLKESNTFRA